MRISDWSSDVCSSDLERGFQDIGTGGVHPCEMAAHIVVEGSQASAAGLADCLFSVVPDGFQIRREYRPGRVEWPGRPEGPVSPSPLFDKDPDPLVQLRQSGKEVSGRTTAASPSPGRSRAITQ